VTARPMQQIDPDVGIPDLVRQLTEDSKRLVMDEVNLGKLEVKENLRTAVRGVLRLAIAFGVGVVALSAFTVFLAALIGRMANGNYWVGALVTGVLELGLAAWLIKTGLARFASPSYTLKETRAELSNTKSWVRNARTL
jgi:putative superfamily III holin-X